MRRGAGVIEQGMLGLVDDRERLSFLFVGAEHFNIGNAGDLAAAITEPSVCRKHSAFGLVDKAEIRPSASQ